MSDEEETQTDEWVEVEISADVLIPLLRQAFLLKSDRKRIKLVLVLDGRAPLNEGDKLLRISVEEWKP